MAANYTFIVDSEHSPAIVLLITGLAIRKASRNPAGLLCDESRISLNTTKEVKRWLRTVGTQRHLNVVVRGGEVTDIVLGNKDEHYPDLNEVSLLEAVEMLQRL